MNKKPLQIQRGIPIPSRNTWLGYADTMRQLGIGDSFLIPATLANVHQVARYVGIRIATKSVEGGMRRIWRIE